MNTRYGRGDRIRTCGIVVPNSWRAFFCLVFLRLGLFSAFSACFLSVISIVSTRCFSGYSQIWGQTANRPTSRKRLASSCLIWQVVDKCLPSWQPILPFKKHICVKLFLLIIERFSLFYSKKGASFGSIFTSQVANSGYTIHYPKSYVNKCNFIEK